MWRSGYFPGAWSPWHYQVISCTKPWTSVRFTCRYVRGNVASECRPRSEARFAYYYNEIHFIYARQILSPTVQLKTLNWGTSRQYGIPLICTVALHFVVLLLRFLCCRTGADGYYVWLKHSPSFFVHRKRKSPVCWRLQIGSNMLFSPNSLPRHGSGVFFFKISKICLKT